MKVTALTDVQKLFLASPLNGAPYWGDLLPEIRWQWPKDTYLQRRLETLKQRTDDIEDNPRG